MMTGSELMYAVAARAKELIGEPIDTLRIRAGTQDTPAASIRELRHHSRGQLIEDILTEEFEERAKEIDVFMDDAGRAVRDGDWT